MRLGEYRVPDAGADALAGNSADPLKACIRFVDGNPTKADIEWIGSGLHALLANMGAVPLERCLRLPNSYNTWRKLSRDQWLCKAASMFEAESSWSAAQKLEAEWTRFIQRGYWQQWRDDEYPPACASDLNMALFYATRLNRSQGLNAKQLSRIIGHSFRAKSP